MKHAAIEWCTVCDAMPVVARGRCRTCYMYLYRHGVDRPAELAKRQPDLNERRLHRHQHR